MVTTPVQGIIQETEVDRHSCHTETQEEIPNKYNKVSALNVVLMILTLLPECVQVALK